MFKDGSIVVVLFITAILIMLGMFIDRTIEDNTRMKSIIVEQQEVIDIQTKALRWYIVNEPTISIEAPRSEFSPVH